jgi:hypothetical protein
MRGSDVTDTVADRKADTMAPEGTPFRRIRLDDDLWQRFDEAVKRKYPDDNRSVVIRRFIRYFVGDTDELPQRPGPRQDSGQ